MISYRIYNTRRKWWENSCPACEQYKATVKVSITVLNNNAIQILTINKTKFGKAYKWAVIKFKIWHFLKNALRKLKLIRLEEKHENRTLALYIS